MIIPRIEEFMSPERPPAPLSHYVIDGLAEKTKKETKLGLRRSLERKELSFPPFSLALFACNFTITNIYIFLRD